jgi:hypothetical protein
LFFRYERQLAARVTELTQRAGDTIAQNIELRREIDEVCSAAQQHDRVVFWSHFYTASCFAAASSYFAVDALCSSPVLQIRRNHVTLKAEISGARISTQHVYYQ